MAQLQQKRANSIGVKTIEQPLPCDIIVDCLFGSGLNKPLNEFSVNLIQTLNTYKG